jgi:hypothetical protein
MKKIFYKILPFTLAVVILAGCTKLEDFGDTNHNPAGTPNPITAALLTNALSQVGGFAASTRQGLYCQYFSETQYTDVSLYSLPKLSSTGNYSGILMDCQDIINNCTNEATSAAAAKSGSLNNQIAIARIIQAYIFWFNTDSWGDVPYTDALASNTDVTYDTQETIYKGNISNLAAAVALFDNGPAIVGDIVFGGDIAKWKKFANSLRIMMALRLSKRYPGAGDYSATEINAALNDAGGLIEDNSDNFVITYVGGGVAVAGSYVNFKSPWYNLYDGRKDFAESEEMVALLNSLNDSRVNVYGSTGLGFPYGLTRDDALDFDASNSGWARILTDDLRTETGKVFVLSASEVSLARAEAADRGWTSENAEGLFVDGIDKGFEKWGLTTPPAYVDTLTFATGTNLNIARIATQQYIASYPNGWFGWANWRRTGYPALTPTPNAVNDSGEIPRRYVYGDTENNLTPDAVKVAVDRLPGGDTEVSSIWWDQ